MKDIGSIFPINDKDFNNDLQAIPENTNKKLFSLCREALSEIAKYELPHGNVVLIPAYTCETVITPFIKNGWECKYYPINKDLTINVEETEELYKLRGASMIVVLPFYGMDLNTMELQLIDEILNCGGKIIVALTQCLFTDQVVANADYYVASYRKWFQIPDGAYLSSKDYFDLQLTEENEIFVKLQSEAMYLRGLYFETQNERLKQISIHLSKMADCNIKFDLDGRKMSALSYSIMQSVDMNAVKSARMDNYKYLFRNIKASKFCMPICNALNNVTSAPLYFPIYSNNRSYLQKALIEQHIYAPVLWPVEYEYVLIDDNTRYIYDSMLVIQVDQRYDLLDMSKIVNILNQS